MTAGPAIEIAAPEPKEAGTHGEAEGNHGELAVGEGAAEVAALLLAGGG